MGTQDSLEFAKDFVSDTKVTFRMLWDDSGLSWQRFGVQIQPSAVLVGTDGSRIAGWRGVIPFEKVLQALSK